MAKKRMIKDAGIGSRKCCGAHRIPLAAIAAILVLAIIYLAAAAPRQPEAMLYFAYSDTCVRCPEIEPVVAKVASDAGIGYKAVKTELMSQFPTLMLVYGDEMLMTRFTDEHSLMLQICGFAKVKRACAFAGEVYEK